MNNEQLEEAVRQALRPEFRGQLLARGQARSLIWRDGELPPDSPDFAQELTYDLLSYGDALLSMGMRLLEAGGDVETARAAFEQAGNAIEAVASKGVGGKEDSGFLRMLAACSFHLAGLSARAFSILAPFFSDENFSRIERYLALVIVRSFEELEKELWDWRDANASSDDALISLIEEYSDQDEGSENPYVSALDLVLTDVFARALGLYLLALETGDGELVEQALELLGSGLETCREMGLVPQWWIFRISSHLLGGLWAASFHTKLPLNLPGGSEEEAWSSLRALFISMLVKRGRAEIELWPSQTNAAQRAVDPQDDLVVSLPTSAGKTRIAELCILRCLASGQRTMFVTPLRALSAQTEISLRRTFSPLGKTVSALYGSIGTNQYEEDVLRQSDIVVATPEKLDFALRNDPTLLDDVGLVVLDEGHMIGINEREVRYEVQIQRLLKRPDAEGRRLVCLSAILPEGDEFDDFVSWLRQEKEGEAITSQWRPTRLRFGEIEWKGKYGRLDLIVEEEAPFVERFVGAKEPSRGLRKKVFPSDQRELAIATAWRLVEDDQTVLIYCPQRRSVEPMAAHIVKLAGYGFLPSLLHVDEDLLETALAIGAEWLGESHDILKCLRMGVAIHHGQLPAAYRREVERLLREGILKVTVSSPTLAQGLNLAATAIVFHSLHRNGELIPSSEFKNIIGRAGRAFIDVEGLVLHPMYDDLYKRRANWKKLREAANDHSVESGLVRLLLALLVRLDKALNNPGLSVLQEYVLNNQAAWSFPEVQGEKAEDRQREFQRWNGLLARLDTAILGLVGDQDVEASELAAKIDEIVSDSLWQKRLLRRKENLRTLIDQTLKARGRHIWKNSSGPQRRGYFLAGVGLATGHQLDEISEMANTHLVAANTALLDDDRLRAIDEITKIASLLFSIPPFAPDDIPSDWKQLLSAWLNGEAISSVSSDQSSRTLSFVEDAFVYRLPWGMESVRVRAQANGDVVGPPESAVVLDELELGLAVPAVETGTLERSAAILIQAGFTSRLAAIAAVKTTQANFSNGHGLRAWLASDEVIQLGESPDWPTRETHKIWREFVQTISRAQREKWEIRAGSADLEQFSEANLPKDGTPLRLKFGESADVEVFTGDFNKVGTLDLPHDAAPIGLVQARLSASGAGVDIKYFGPADFLSSIDNS